MSSSFMDRVIAIDQEKLQQEFDRIRDGGFKSLKEAFPSPMDRRIFPSLFRRAGLWRSSFKRTFGVMTLPKDRSEYKKKWAAEHRESVKKSREQYVLRQREQRVKKNTPPPCENVLQVE